MSPFAWCATARRPTTTATTVLCAHSDLFYKKFSENPVKQENGTSMTELREDDPVHFDIFLEWLYTLTLEIPVCYLGDIQNATIPLAVSKFIIPSGHNTVANGSKMVEAYYTPCKQSGSAMGKAMAHKFLNGNRAFIKNMKFTE
ncbi:hypothetical protein BU23DRAFT_575083 [Bimuria novae-zelandiae CBS 107.79]|uniref:BTB domain-containing protein n=1 Tax=Bimuria novae-zelandiae CBS 107.79 TaxID=1447943 RepID=A0A6A5UKI6_9PLEO|nr:hypothetical protein BU23DRAFT_575083 [Bimuria novae-zelandiae CBS 107.79]